MQKPGTKPSNIQIPPGYTAEEADFYRRGFRDGEQGTPKDMKGYPDNLKLAYATGGFAGALSARPPVAAKARAHVAIGHERSLCGLAPKNGTYKILGSTEFVLAADDEQCAVCRKRFAGRGYNIKQLRQRLLAEQARPRLPLAA